MLFHTHEKSIGAPPLDPQGDDVEWWIRCCDESMSSRRQISCMGVDAYSAEEFWLKYGHNDILSSEHSFRSGEGGGKKFTRFFCTPPPLLLRGDPPKKKTSTPCRIVFLQGGFAFNLHFATLCAIRRICFISQRVKNWVSILTMLRFSGELNSG